MRTIFIMIVVLLLGGAGSCYGYRGHGRAFVTAGL